MFVFGRYLGLEISNTQFAVPVYSANKYDNMEQSTINNASLTLYEHKF